MADAASSSESAASPTPQADGGGDAARPVTAASSATAADSTCYNSVGQRNLLRLFICHDSGRDSMDIPEGKTVAAIKQVIKDRFKIRVEKVQPGDINFERNTLVLAYAGAELHDNWVLSDMGIKSGSVLRAYVKEEIDPVLFLRVGYSGAVIPILERFKLRNYPVATLRSIASRRSGLPVGVFRLVSRSGHEMYDCHTLDRYHVEPGDIISVETWDGWSELLNLAAHGFTSHLLERLSTDEVTANFQMKVALYVAAHYGQVELSTTLTRQRGIGCDIAVGQHPLKQWCTDQPHPDLRKAPIHEAVEAGQLSVLRVFVHHNVCAIMVRDGNGLQPLNLALRQKKKTCASFLLTKQWSRIAFHNSSVPLAIYARMKNWTERARGQLLAAIMQDRAVQKKMLLSRQHPLVGQGVYIDGYSEQQLNSSKRPPPPKAETSLTRAVERYYRRKYGQPEEHFRLATRGMKVPKQQSKWSKMATNKEAEEQQQQQQQQQPPDRLPPLVAKGNAKQAKGQKAAKVEEGGGSRPASSAKSADANRKEQGKQAKAAPSQKRPKQPPATLLAEAKGKSSTIPLPISSVQDTPRPFLHLRGDEPNEVKRTLDRYYANRGVGPRQYAIECLSVAHNFKEKPWLHQVRLAMSFTEAGVRKMTTRNSHNLLSCSVSEETK